MSSAVLLLKPEDYYSQRNNQVKPLSACMPTARVMWYKGNEINFSWEISSFAQPEDYFMHLLNTPEAIAFCHKKYLWTTNRRDEQGNPLPDIPPNEVHGMYGSWLDEKVTGKRRSDFITSLTWESLLKYLDNGHVIMSAGEFPGTDGHAVDFIGFEPDSETYYIADPWGDFRLNYADVHGYAVPMTKSEFDRIITQFPDTTGKCGHVPI